MIRANDHYKRQNRTRIPLSMNAYAEAFEARKNCRYQKTGTGAVLTYGRSRHYGFSGYPDTFLSLPEHMLRSREFARLHIIHAEVRVLQKAYMDHNSLYTMYVTSFPCTRCLSLLLDYRVERLVCPPPNPLSSWCQDQEAAKKLIKDLSLSWFELIELDPPPWVTR